jgi:hypothetical protein
MLLDNITLNYSRVLVFGPKIIIVEKLKKYLLKPTEDILIEGMTVRVE